jgi:hypothetical protein
VWDSILESTWKGPTLLPFYLRFLFFGFGDPGLGFLRLNPTPRSNRDDNLSGEAVTPSFGCDVMTEEIPGLLSLAKNRYKKTC